jgi:hypothetical protein
LGRGIAMKSLIRPGTGRPGLVDDAQRRVAVLHVVGDDAQRDEVVDLLDLDLLPLQLLADAPQALDAAVDLDDRDVGLASFAVIVFLSSPMRPLGGAPLGVDLGAQRS